MLGLGETMDEVRAVIDDIAALGVDVLALGQYLSPSKRHLPVARYVEPRDRNSRLRTARPRASSAPSAECAGVKGSGAVVDGEDLDIRCVEHSINDAIAEYEHLAQVGTAQFGDDSAGEREQRNPIGGVEHLRREDRRHSRCVAGDEQAGGVEIVERLEGPTYGSQRAIRRRASS